MKKNQRLRLGETLSRSCARPLEIIKEMKDTDDSFYELTGSSMWGAHRWSQFLVMTDQQINREDSEVRSIAADCSINLRQMIEEELDAIGIYNPMV